MKYFVLMVFILSLIFGWRVALSLSLSIAGIIWFLAVVIVFVGSICMAISNLLGVFKEKNKVLRNDKIESMLSWAGVAIFFGWILGFFF